MNLIKSVAGVILILALGASVPVAQAAKPDFSQLAGRYKASFLVVTGTTVISSSNLQVTVTVPKSGNSAKMQIIGFSAADLGGGGILNVATLGNLVFSAQKVSADNALIAFYAQLPAASLASSSKNKVQFTLVNSSLGASSTAVMTYTLRFNKRRFSIVGNGSLGPSPTTVVLKSKKLGK